MEDETITVRRVLTYVGTPKDIEKHLALRHVRGNRGGNKSVQISEDFPDGCTVSVGVDTREGAEWPANKMDKI